MTAEQLGELAYTAFCSGTGPLMSTDRPSRRWDELDPHLREAWCNAARAIWWQIMGTELPPAGLVVEDTGGMDCPYCGFLWPPGYTFSRCPGCQQVYDGG